MNSTKRKKNKEQREKSKKDVENQLQRIHLMATWLPWITVSIILISMLLILLEVYFTKGS